MRDVPREWFVPHNTLKSAYQDAPLSIGAGQTISQPYIVAFMLQALMLRPTDRVLEIGTGSGYNTALLAHLCKDGGRVFSIENIQSLHEEVRARLHEHKLDHNIEFKLADGSEGWPEHAPFDAIILTAAPTKVPASLFEQLKDGGRLIAPEGAAGQHRGQILRLYVRRGKKIESECLMNVQFVPMTTGVRES